MSSEYTLVPLDCPSCGAGIRPDAQRNREVAPDGSGFEFHLNDARLLVDVIVRIKRRIEAKAGTKGENNVCFTRKT